MLSKTWPRLRRRSRLAFGMAFSIIFVAASVALLLPQPQPRHPRIACCATTASSPIATEIAFLRKGTRLGYAVHADLGSVPSSIDKPTPLPDVLTQIDGERFPSMSRARKACRRGTVLVNGVEGRCITNAVAGDLLSLQSRVAPGFTPRGRAPFPVDVLYEDDSLAVVFKPAGVCTHPPPGGSPGGSMRTAIMHALKPPPMGTPGALYRPHCVHRLDRPTSGLLLCAKTKQSLLSLNAAFRLRRVSKRYEAIVCGYVEGESGDIDHEIDGREAQTSWKVLSRARSLRVGGGHVTHLSLSPRTGRTHQLRKHCSEVLKCPILGDKAYGGEDVGSGLFLAALELTFDHPEEEAPVHVHADAPKKFGDLLAREHERWERLGDEEDGSSRPSSSSIPTLRTPLRTPRARTPTLLAEIPFDIQFLRTAKSALRQSLKESSGSLDEDALATIYALADVNPSKPNPAEDIDLWSGEWGFTTTIPLGAEQATLVGTADIGVDGAISLRCDVMMGGATAVTVELSGTVSDATDDVLELACDRVKLEGSSEDAAKLVSDAMGWTIDSEGLVSSALPTLRLAQLYLDQDCHIVGPLAEGAADDDEDARRRRPLVLFKR